MWGTLWQTTRNRISGLLGGPWAIPVVSLLAALDAFFVFVPTDALLVSITLARPKKWVLAFLSVTTGSAMGALAVGALCQILGGTGGFESLKSGPQAEWISDFGPAAVAFIAAGPLPFQPSIVISALAGMPLPVLFISVWLGRALKYAFFAGLAAWTPGFVMRLPFFKNQKTAQSLT